MYKYDVALSYESKNESLVKEVAEYLSGDNWNVFFAPKKQKEMLSEDLKRKLYQIYQNESMLKVLFVTKEYFESEFTQLEQRCALRCAEENCRRLIIVNFVGKDLPESLSRYTYMDGISKVDEIVFAIGERLKELRIEEEKRTEDKLKKEEKQKHYNNNIFIGNNREIVIGDNNNFHGIHF